jgi:hypothetical protein
VAVGANVAECTIVLPKIWYHEFHCAGEKRVEVLDPLLRLNTSVRELIKQTKQRDILGHHDSINQ